jgi:hypothetical protein
VKQKSVKAVLDEMAVHDCMQQVASGFREVVPGAASGE